MFLFHHSCYVATLLQVQISVQDKRVPAGVGIASDPMVVRRSGKKLPMEDISFCQCPVQGVEQVSNKLIPDIILNLCLLTNSMVNQLYFASLGSSQFLMDMVGMEPPELPAS